MSETKRLADALERKVAFGGQDSSFNIRDRFAKVTAERVSGRLNVNDGNGEVIVNDSGGDAEIKTSFVQLLVHNVYGGLIVNNTKGRVEATSPAPLH